LGLFGLPFNSKSEWWCNNLNPVYTKFRAPLWVVNNGSADALINCCLTLFDLIGVFSEFAENISVRFYRVLKCVVRVHFFAFFRVVFHWSFFL